MKVYVLDTVEKKQILKIFGCDEAITSKNK